MLDFDDLDEAEQANEPPPKTDEERRRDEEAAFFKRLLDSEVVAEQRWHQDEFQEGILGVLLEIPAPKAKEVDSSRDSLFFCDVVNGGLRKFRKLQGLKDNGAMAEVRLFEVPVDALMAYFDWILQSHFWPEDAVWWSELFASHFVGGKQSFCSLVEEWLAPGTKKRHFPAMRAAVDASLRRLLTILRRLITSIVAFDQQKVVHDQSFSQLMITMFPGAPPPLHGSWFDQGLGYDWDDVCEVVMRVHGTDEERTLVANMSFILQELKQILEDWIPREKYKQLEFFGLPVTPNGKLVKLHLASKLSEAGGALVLKGLEEGALPSPQEAAVYPEAMERQAPDWVVDWRSRRMSKICKTTLVSATRILYELRFAFTEESFQERYHALRKEAKQGNKAHRDAVEMTFSVQSAILPKYGFEATPRGLQEMRDEMPLYAGWNTWHWQPHLPNSDEVVWKIRRDIHCVLDMGQQIPRMPIARAMSPIRFDPADKDQWRKHLAEEGYVVISGVAEEQQVHMAYHLLWDFIEGTDKSGKIKRSDLSTWGDADRSGNGWPAGKADGIIHGRGIGQSQVLWFLRTLPNVRKVFADLWDTEHLVTSFDGAGVFRPYGHDPGWRIEKTDQGWCHVDQAHQKPGLHCVQGLVTLKDATEHTGGFVVVPGSHRFFGCEILRRYGATRDGWNFISLRANDPVLTEGGLGPRLVCANAGDLVLWDSRTVHCNTLPLKEDQKLLYGTDLIRAVCYICMTPAAWCTPEVIQKRRTSFGLGVTTSHWPHEHFADSTHPFPTGFQLNREQLRLCCPQMASDWSEEFLKEAPPPGRVSVLPPEKFVAVQDTPILSSPSTELGVSVGMLKKGQLAQGYNFGRWLHLGENLPVEGQTATSESGEAWACIGTLKPAPEA